MESPIQSCQVCSVCQQLCMWLHEPQSHHRKQAHAPVGSSDALQCMLDTQSRPYLRRGRNLRCRGSCRHTPFRMSGAMKGTSSAEGASWGGRSPLPTGFARMRRRALMICQRTSDLGLSYCCAGVGHMGMT